jgi:hypothetical protein
MALNALKKRDDPSYTLPLNIVRRYIAETIDDPQMHDRSTIGKIRINIKFMFHQFSCHPVAHFSGVHPRHTRLS